jgi:predicted nucleic acid-binding protein
MILVDTSAWIEYDRATGSATDDAVTHLISDGGARLASTEPVLMKVLAGAGDDRRRESLWRLLNSFGWLPIDPVADFTGAATIFRSCSASGITPRSLINCMIANIAIRTGSQLLAKDRDFADIATVVPLQVVAD